MAVLTKVKYILMRRFPALYTRRLTQTRKNFQDGFVDIEEMPSGRIVLRLLDEDESLLERITVPDLPPLDGTDFRIGGCQVQIYADEEISVPQPRITEKPSFKPPSRVNPAPVIQPPREPTVVVEVRNSIRTVDEVIQLYLDASSDLKHDSDTIRSNLTAFLE